MNTALYSYHDHAWNRYVQQFLEAIFFENTIIVWHRQLIFQQ